MEADSMNSRGIIRGAATDVALMRRSPDIRGDARGRHRCDHRGPAGTIGPVTRTDDSDDQAAQGRRRVVLDLDLGSEPIGGSLRVGAQPAQPFAGYTQLISTLDAARASAPGGQEMKALGEPSEETR